MQYEDSSYHTYMIVPHSHPILILSSPPKLELPPLASSMRRHHLLWFNVSGLYIMQIFQALLYPTIDNSLSSLRGAGHPVVSRTVPGQEVTPHPYPSGSVIGFFFAHPWDNFSGSLPSRSHRTSPGEGYCAQGESPALSWAESALNSSSLPFSSTPRDTA